MRSVEKSETILTWVTVLCICKPDHTYDNKDVSTGGARDEADARIVSYNFTVA